MVIPVRFTLNTVGASPLLGKNRMMTFKFYFIADKTAYEEHEDACFEFVLSVCPLSQTRRVCMVGINRGAQCISCADKHVLMQSKQHVLHNINFRIG
jgi:hypothetical protein